MRELHARLVALGFATHLEGDAYSHATASVVESFQRSRGLPLTGIVDEVTWSRLDEARWKLGQRLLYLTKPYLRGDDVAELQVRLSQLGFDPGRVDGVFGPLLDAALSDFQRNCGVEAHGTLTLRTLTELRRLAPRSDRTLVTDARAEAGFEQMGRGPIVVWGDSPLVAGLATHITSADFDQVRSAWSVEEIAAYANALSAQAVVSVACDPAATGISLHYWSSYRSYSRRGEQLASAVAQALAQIDQPLRLEITGMALPILRETRMATLHLIHGSLTDSTRQCVADAVADAVNNFFHS